MKRACTSHCFSAITMLHEKIALQGGYIVSRKQYLNVGFTPGIVQRVPGSPAGSPASMFTCVFAMACTVG